MSLYVQTILGDLRVIRGFNIYIDVTAACNAHCPFCIAPVINRKDGYGFYDGVGFALELSARTDGTFQIVGGEPTISKRFVPLLNQIRKYKIRRIVLNTNAAQLDDDCLDMLKWGGVTHVNISRHHYDEAMNQKIMLQRPFVSNDEIKKRIKTILRRGIEVRLNCNLIAGQIDSLREISRFIDWGVETGCTTFSFSQLFPLGAFGFQMPPVPGYTENHQVDLNSMVTELDNTKFFTPYGLTDSCSWGNSWGSSTWSDGIMPHRRFWKRSSDNSILSIKTLSGYDGSSGLPNEAAYDSYDDQELRPGILALAVVHSDGLVTIGWDKRKRILFTPANMIRDSFFVPKCDVICV